MTISVFRAAAVALVLSLSACDHASYEVRSSTGGATNSGATNLGLAVLELVGEGDLWLVAASERGQGIDLDGDGDALDAVLFVFDAGAGTLENLGLPVAGQPSPAGRFVADGRAVFPVSEAALGADLNGDGDALDLVLHLFDVRKPSVENLSVAVPARRPIAPRLEGGLLLFGVDEEAQGLDLDGDGVLAGEIAHVRDFTRGVTQSGRRMPSRAMHAADRRAAFLVAESAATGDLNGDGDTSDGAVLEIYDGPRGFMLDSGLATAGGGALLAAGFAAVLVSEEQQGLDLDGDGDLFDLVYHDFDPFTGLARNLGLEGATPASLEGPNVFALLVVEGENLGDLDGDGDRADTVPFLHEPLRGRTTNLGLAQSTGFAPLFLERSLVVIVSEEEQGRRDLDGDGDAIDLVPHVFDLVNRTTTNLAVDGIAFRAAAGRLLFARREIDALVDWNGDGDTLDAVLFAWEEATNQIVNTRVAAIDLLDARSTRALLVQSEALEARDLNGDGDELDRVFASYDFGTGLSARVGLAGCKGALVADDAALVLVDEAGEGRDLDLDGDQLDVVLHRVDFTP